MAMNRKPLRLCLMRSLIDCGELKEEVSRRLKYCTIACDGYGNLSYLHVRKLKGRCMYYTPEGKDDNNK